MFYISGINFTRAKETPNPSKVAKYFMGDEDTRYKQVYAMKRLRLDFDK
jgi:hypothetical protein